MAALDWPFLVLVLALAFAWAKLEIEIEGPDGWAKNLPTWRLEKHWLADLLFGGAEVTGYHLWAFAATLMFLHLRLLGDPWTWRAELHVLGSHAIFWLVEDFLWFVLNPHYGRRALTPERVWWHRRWFLGFPANYWIMAPVGLLLYLAPAF